MNARAVLEDGIIDRPRDGDLAAVLGFGFPPFLGGPFRYADSIGAETIVSRLVQMQHGYGGSFAPASLLRRFADEGGTFYPEGRA